MPEKNLAEHSADGSYQPRVRLFVETELTAGAWVELEQAQAHYLTNVMRLGVGDEVCLFNGRDGEWRAEIREAKRKACIVEPTELLRAQSAEPDIWLLFAPLKKARTDYLAEKATELGASMLWPVYTQRTVAERVNLERLRANAVEAAEQSERLSVPQLRAPAKLMEGLADWPAERRLILCDESGTAKPIVEALTDMKPGEPCALLIGPEGGFSAVELDALRKLPFVKPVGLGPRVLRADTAALAALACLQALAGDWRKSRI
ncbi:MAG TPA: 16S rRNA (uracil(1498)-N(3))-methyltransferase [Alphaproteobacteria bacterium]|nr:16S rRNA (uracil(1498)-N(3))-methyltransferase [Alphaproteobacteria bacterium]